MIYDSIHTCPIWNWWHIRKTRDLSFLLSKKRILSDKEKKKFQDIYKKMLAEYEQEIPKSDAEKRAQELRDELIDRCLTRVIDKDDSQWTWIDLAKKELEDMAPEQGDEVSLYQIKISLEKFLKIPIDIKKCTVIEFYEYVKYANESKIANVE